MRWFLALMVLFGACGDERSDERSEADPEDGGVRQRTDSPRVTPALGFSVRGGTGTTLTLSPLSTQASVFGEATFGAPWASVPVEGRRVELAVATPPEAHFRAVAPGVEVAAYAPVLHQDVDGDGVPGDGEWVVGAGRWWPAYARSTGGDLAGLGLVEGWNALRWGNVRDGGRGDPADLPLTRNLGPVETLEAGGAAFITDAGDYGFVVLPQVVLDGGDARAVLDDEVLGFSWETRLDRPPPEDHYAVVDGVGLVGAEERIFAYLDRDHDDRYGGTDGLVWEACLGAGLRLTWFDPPGDAEEAVALARRGVPGGWSAWVDEDGGRRRLSAEARTSLLLSPSCPVE